MMLIAAEMMQHSTTGRMWSFLYRGSMAGTVIRQVPAVVPSRWAMVAMIPVAMVTRTMLFPAFLAKKFMRGSNMPTSFIKAK